MARHYQFKHVSIGLGCTERIVVDTELDTLYLEFKNTVQCMAEMMAHTVQLGLLDARDMAWVFSLWSLSFSMMTLRTRRSCAYELF